MRIGVTAGFGAPIGTLQLGQMSAIGIEVVRQDVPATGDLRPLVEDFVAAPVRPLFLLGDPARNEPLLDLALRLLGPDGFDLQVYNEPGLFFHGSLTDYTVGIGLVYRDARLRGFRGAILAGGVANLGTDNLRWLRAAVPALPTDVVIDFHRYSYKTQSQSRPWPGFASRDAELETVRQIAAGRPVACTEFGYHTAEEESGFLWWRRRTRATDDQVRAWLAADLALFSSHGLTLACIYQWGDGPTDSWINRFGLRDPSGYLKPSARAIADWRPL